MSTWNPVVGCTRASAGCDNCYAVKQSYRLEHMGQAKYRGLTVLNAKGERHFNGVVRTDEAALTIPLKWRKPRTIFVNSMSDLFHRDVPFEFIDKVFAAMALCPQHTFQVLTKRPERMAEYLNEAVPCDLGLIEIAGRKPAGYTWPLPNVWLGTSCENQQTADERIPHLLKCPAAIRFLSCEPLLGPVHLPESRCVRCNYTGHGRANKHGCAYGSGAVCPKCQGYLSYTKPFDWVIVGGESGAGARPCDIDWVRSIVKQCAGAGVACFVKQFGKLPMIDEKSWRASKPMPLLSEKKSRLCPDGFSAVHLDDQKGGNINEFPSEFKVREMPHAK
jgi:protein gp37